MKCGKLKNRGKSEKSVSLPKVSFYARMIHWNAFPFPGSFYFGKMKSGKLQNVRKSENIGKTGNQLSAPREVKTVVGAPHRACRRRLDSLAPEQSGAT